MKHPLPEVAFKGHIAVVGMTGGGKTFTTKGIVEHILSVDPAARVCVLDPIKSDWWGITSNASGKRPGLPFQILGGPRGHVPLHESTGKAIGELVGSGALPLSIIDMADFGPGGLQTFFNDFAPALLRKIRGVVHLVLEEAHEFAPKERAGFGGESMTVHFAKKLATAGRSKGIRIIAATQRTQQLHNSVLGSCQTVVAHQLTYPADIEPVAKWFKGHVDKATFAEFSDTLTSLPTGTGWMCSGQAKVARMVQFPPIWTFDNSATPDGAAEIDVTTAPVDREKLRQIMGDAAKEAEANDPATLKAEIQRLKVELLKKPTAMVDQAAATLARQTALTEGMRRGFDEGAAAQRQQYGDRIRAFVDAVEAAKTALLAPMPHPSGITHQPAPAVARAIVRETVHAMERPIVQSGAKPTADGLSKGERAVLTVLAQFHPTPIAPRRAAAIAGYSVRASTWRGILAKLRARDAIDGTDPLGITPAGLTALGDFEPLPTGRALLDHWLARLPKGQAETLRVLAAIGGHGQASDVASRAGYSTAASTWRGILAGQRTLCLVEGSRTLKLHEDLR